MGEDQGVTYAVPGELVVPARFCGPARSGNGGWTCGALAAHVDGPHDATLRVSLHQPPPLDTAMEVDRDREATVARLGGEPVARAVPDIDTPVAVGAVSADEARAAEASYRGLESHPFPTCFSCGTGREPGDGLRIFPGRVADHDGAARVAATWTPHPSVSEDWHEYVDDVRHASLPVTWAALDCVGAWAGDFGERLLVLGTMTARVHARPRVGEEHVVVGMDRGREGRKTFTASALYDSTGRLVGQAEHVWIAVDAAAFN
jgi:hypothetical protein